MPPLRKYGQSLLNMLYILNNEKTHSTAHTKWVLNHIWNETEFKNIYSALISSGVNRRDIILQCFDMSKFATFDNIAQKLHYINIQVWRVFYFTSHNFE